MRLRLEVDVNDAEAPGEAKGPLEVVEEDHTMYPRTSTPARIAVSTACK